MPGSSLVSVVMPSYNHEAYLAVSIASVLAQSHSELELIIIDDGSVDQSREIIKRFQADPRVRPLFRDNKGAPATLNEGISLARGEWISIINSDDAFDPLRLELMIKYLKESETRWAFSRVDFIDYEGIRLDTPATRWYRDLQNSIAHSRTVGFALLAANVTLSTGNFFFAKSLVAEIGLFRELDLVHDWDYALRMLRCAEPVFVEEPLYKYRLHKTNTIRAIPQSTTDREVNFVLRDFLLNVCATPPRNPRAPSPHNWPDFDEVIARLDFQGKPYGLYMPSMIENQYLSNG